MAPQVPEVPVLRARTSRDGRSLRATSQVPASAVCLSPEKRCERGTGIDVRRKHAGTSCKTGISAARVLRGDRRGRGRQAAAAGCSTQRRFRLRWLGDVTSGSARRGRQASQVRYAAEPCHHQRESSIRSDRADRCAWQTARRLPAAAGRRRGARLAPVKSCRAKSRRRRQRIDARVRTSRSLAGGCPEHAQRPRRGRPGAAR